MLTPKKIEEWLKEVEERPDSAALILRYITDRLNELTARNEELLADQIALQSGQRVKEYEKRIAHLEYQLQLLKRKVGGGELPALDDSVEPEAPCAINLLAYQTRGRILRLEIPVDTLASESTPQPIGLLADKLQIEGEPARLLAVSGREELLLCFTSGRVSPTPVSAIPAVLMGASWTWAQSALPDEVRADEKLVCLMPLLELPLADYFIQVSRRGCVKKTMTSMSKTILEKRYIGKGVIQKADQPFEIMLAQDGDLLVIFTREGHLLALDVERLSYAAEERIRLDATDHVVSAFTVKMGVSLLALTQTGKVLHRELVGLEQAKSPLAKGLALIPPSRLEKGTRLIGAVPVHKKDWCLALHTDGRIILEAVHDLFTAGSLHTENELLAIATFPDPKAVRE